MKQSTLHTLFTRAIIVTGIVGLSLAGMAQPAAAGTCDPTAVTISTIDSTAVNIDQANACEGAFTGNLNPNELIDDLEDGTLFSGFELTSAKGFDWTYVGKEGENGSGTVTNDNTASGDWTADTGSLGDVDTLAILLKQQNAYSVFLFTGLFPAGSFFEGTYDIILAGLEGDSLSHLDVAGLLVGTVIPIPATLPLFLTGLFGLGFLARRRRQLAES